MSRRVDPRHRRYDVMTYGCLLCSVTGTVEDAKRRARAIDDVEEGGIEIQDYITGDIVAIV